MRKILIALLVLMATSEGNICSTVGSFEVGTEFKSYDNEVWWAFTAEELGFEPKANETYTLTYDNNGTTDCTECPKELECECEVYDDIFVGIRKGGI